MAETFDALLMPQDNKMKRRSNPGNGPAFLNDMLSEWSTVTGPGLSHTTALSPPPMPRTTSPRPRPEKLSLRLRSNSGLALHTNQAAFRQYTEYNADGSTVSPRSPTFTFGPSLMSPEGMTSIDAVSGGTFGKRLSGGYLAEPETASNPLILDIFHRDVLQVVLNTPSTGQRLCKFALLRNRGGNVEFLQKVNEYSEALKNFTSILNSISTTFTSITATSPLALPHELSNNVNVHIKHFARSMLPLLDKLFRDAKLAVEDRVAKDVYPEFVKYQFSQCMKSSLSISRSLTGGFKTAYPGLGDAFCLTDPTKPGHPMVFASDGLVRLSGFYRSELLQRNCKLMQGMTTDEGVIQRLREAIELKKETCELILNYRKDGTAFWNLLFICPLVEQGRVRYFLGAQINVSESLGTHYKDILRVLNFGPATGEPVAEKPTDAQDRALKRTSGNFTKGLERAPSVKSRDDRDLRRRSERRFFKTFSRKSNISSTALPRPDTRESMDDNNENNAFKRPSSSRRPNLASPKPEEAHTPYSLFFVLRYVPASARSPRPDRRSASTRLHVAFCSTQALEMLGLDANEKNVILGKDIFAVLLDQANSPTVSRTLKAAVRDRLDAGETISVDVLVSSEPGRQTSRRGKKTSILGLSSRSREGVGLGVSGAPAGPAVSTVTLAPETSLRSKKSETFDRSADAVSSVFFGPKMRRMVSHWTPLKDFEGRIEMVVLIMTPATV